MAPRSNEVLIIAKTVNNDVNLLLHSVLYKTHLTPNSIILK